MGTTFVHLTYSAQGDEPGFWMRDALLEVWLRLLALHLPEPTSDGANIETLEIRNRWLLASRGYFNGCVPHDMVFACSTPQGRSVVRAAIDSLVKALNASDAPLEAQTLNLLGNDDLPGLPVQRDQLREIAQAFIDLLEGRITTTAASKQSMPGARAWQLPQP